MERSVAQLSCWKFPHMRRYCSSSWLTCADSPSVCRWKAVDNFCLIPNFCQNSWVTYAANCRPWSKMIVKGKLVHFQTLSISDWLVCSVVIVLWQGNKIMALLYRSTTVRIELYPFDTGKSVIKSIIMVSQMPCGISLGFSGTLTSGLILVVWQVAHPLIYAFTNVMIPSHQKSLMINSMVFHSYGCPISSSWYCCTTLQLRFSLFGT